MEDVHKQKFSGENFLTGKQLHVKWMSAKAAGGKLSDELAHPLLFCSPAVP